VTITGPRGFSSLVENLLVVAPHLPFELRLRELDGGERFERALVANLPERQRRVVLKRAVELSDARNRVERERRLVVAERLDDAAAKEVLAARHVTDQCLACGGDFHALARRGRSERATDRRTDELALFGVERFDELRDQRAIRVVFEEAVRDGAEPIVGTRQRFAHRVLRARIVEPGQQDECPVADVAVAVFGYRLNQRGHRLRRRSTAHEARRVRPRGVIEIAELGDRRLELYRRNRLGRAGLLLRACNLATAEDSEDRDPES